MILRRRSLLVRGLALLAVLAAWLPFFVSLAGSLAGGVEEWSLGTLGLKADGLSFLMTGTVLALGTLVILFSGPYMAGEVGEEKYYAMLLAMMGLMIGLVCATDLFNLWVWFEGMAISSYLLVAFYREQPASLEAGMKYLVQSATGSVMVLLGIALVLARFGTLNMAAVADMAASGRATAPGLLAAGALFIIGFGVKVALVPLHTWLPDAHSQAPSGISAMLSGVVIEIGLMAMLRALASLAGFSHSWGVILMAFGALNMLYGNLLALRQTAIKRMLAYSSLSHIGYILLGLGIALYSGVALGAQGAFFHLFNHMLMKGLAFLAVGALMYGLLLQNGSHAGLKIADLAGAAGKYPLVALALSIAVLGLGGLPPLAGFMSKWQIFVAGFRDAQRLDHCIDGLHGAQQRALAGILRPAGEPDVPRPALRTGAEGQAPALAAGAAAAGDDLRRHPAGLPARPDGRADRPRRPAIHCSIWCLSHDQSYALPPGCFPDLLRGRGPDFRPGRVVLGARPPDEVQDCHLCQRRGKRSHPRRARLPAVLRHRSVLRGAAPGRADDRLQ